MTFKGADMGISRKFAAAVAVAALALTGCAQSPSMAARVGDVTISEQQVNDATDAISEAFEVGPGQARTVAFAALMRGALAENLEAKYNHTITDSERDAVLASDPTLAMLSTHEKTKELANGVADGIVMVQRIGSDAIVDEVASLGVTLNPRYGTWNADTGEFGGSGSLSREAEDLLAP